MDMSHSALTFVVDRRDQPLTRREFEAFVYSLFGTLFVGVLGCVAFYYYYSWVMLGKHPWVGHAIVKFYELVNW